MKKKILLLILPLIAGLTGCGNNTQVADKVIYGNIVTMDESNPSAQAVAMKDGKIIAVGSKDDIKKHINEKTTVHEHNNDYVYPGFVDAHTHYAVMPTMFAGGIVIAREGPHKLGDYAAYAKLMKEFIDSNPDKQIYQGMGIWVVGDAPTAAILDEYCPSNKPIVLIGSGGHDCWINTAAIKHFIGDYTKEEEKAKVDAWINMVGKDCVEFIEKDGHMIPTGYFCETARFKITDMIPHETNDIKDVIKVIQDITLSKGYTAIGDCTIVENEYNKQVTAFKELEAEGRLKFKYRSYYEVKEYDSAEVRKAELEKAITFAKETKNNEYFKIVGIKIFLDGVYEARSSYTSFPYDTPVKGKSDNYSGIGRWKNMQTELNNLVKDANAAGLSVEFHAMGDAAIKQALDACEYSAEQNKVSGKPDYRNKIAHCGYVDQTNKDPDGFTKGLTDLQRFGALGVIAVVNPNWTAVTQSIYPQEKSVLGEAKAEELFLIKSYIDAGATVAFHSDGNPPTGVTQEIFSATTRLEPDHLNDYDGRVRKPEECLSAQQSLVCSTVNAAYSIKSENSLGMIKVGYDADFTVYNKDYRIDAVAKSIEDYKSVKLLALYSNGHDLLKDDLLK